MNKRSFSNQAARLFGGKVLFTFAQWLVLALLAKFGGLDESGQYTLALATTAPIYLFFDLNLRVTRSTDHQHNENFENYLGLKIWAVLCAFLISTTLCFYLYDANFLLFLAIGIYRVGESLSTLAYGGFQRMELSDRIGKSMTYKGVFAMLIVLLIAPLTGLAVYVAIAMAVLSFTWAIAWDLPRAWNVSHPDQRLGLGKVIECMKDVQSATRIAKRSLPLGFDALVSSLALNMPKYCIKYFFGDSPLAVYGVLSQLAFSFQMMIGSVGHVGVPVLSDRYQKGKKPEFWRLTKRMVAYSLAVGTFAIIAGTLIIPYLMGKMFAPEFDQRILMLLLLVASCLCGAQRTLGRATQACGAYFWYTLFDVVIFSVSALVAVWLVPVHTLHGAAIALVVAFGIGFAVTLFHTYYFLWNDDTAQTSNLVA